MMIFHYGGRGRMGEWVHMFYNEGYVLICVSGMGGGSILGNSLIVWLYMSYYFLLVVYGGLMGLCPMIM
jgi:hypothetical protein